MALAGLGFEEEAIREGERAVADYPISKDSIWSQDLIEDLAFTYTMVGEHEKAIEQLAVQLSMPAEQSANRGQAPIFE